MRASAHRRQYVADDGRPVANVVHAFAGGPRNLRRMAEHPHLVEKIVSRCMASRCLSCSADMKQHSDWDPNGGKYSGIKVYRNTLWREKGEMNCSVQPLLFSFPQQPYRTPMPSADCPPSNPVTSVPLRQKYRPGCLRLSSVRVYVLYHPRLRLQRVPYLRAALLPYGHVLLVQGIPCLLAKLSDFSWKPIGMSRSARRVGSTF